MTTTDRASVVWRLRQLIVMTREGGSMRGGGQGPRPTMPAAQLAVELDRRPVTRKP